MSNASFDKKETNISVFFIFSSFNIGTDQEEVIYNTVSCLKRTVMILLGLHQNKNSYPNQIFILKQCCEKKMKEECLTLTVCDQCIVLPGAHILLLELSREWSCHGGCHGHHSLDLTAFLLQYKNNFVLFYFKVYHFNMLVE